MNLQNISAQTAQKLARQFYGVDLTLGQAEIMAAVLDMRIKRVAILGATQIQKTRASALAYGILAALGVTISVVAPKEEQAITPLQYLIQVLDYNSFFRNKMLQGGEQKMERLKAQESKGFISFKSGGFIKAITLNEKDTEDRKKAALGKGSMMVAEEESSLLSNITDAMATRMVGGYGDLGKVVKLGNAITREEHSDHFFKATEGADGFKLIKIDYKRALEEGIFTQAFIDEMMGKPMFDSLYQCIFPDPAGLVKGGYRRLYKLEDIIKATEKGRAEQKRNGQPILGLDIGYGKPDSTSLVARWDDYAERVFEGFLDDPVAQLREYLPIIKELNPLYVNVDATGSEAIAPLLREEGIVAYGQHVGESSPEEGFGNRKAYGHFQAEEWVHKGGALGAGNWSDELKEIAAKIRMDKDRVIEKKEELQARGVASYNDAEALMLTFLPPDEQPIELGMPMFF